MNPSLDAGPDVAPKRGSVRLILTVGQVRALAGLTEEVEGRRDLSGLETEGQVALYEAAGQPGPNLTGSGEVPADLIDRAVEIAAPVWREGCYDERDLAEVIEAAASLLVEHGRQQERAKWEARIERLAVAEDDRAAVHRRNMPGSDDYQTCVSAFHAGARTHAAQVLRSLLTGEGENLVVFSSRTDPEGVYGPPQIYTAWGFRDEDAPRVDRRDYKDENGRTIRQVCRRFVPLENGGQENE